VKVLLDSCTLLWATLSPATLSQPAREIIGDPANVILVSAASAWEIAMKVRLGKLAGAENLERSFLEVMEAAGYTLVEIDTAAALRAGRMTAAHRDPFDRMLAAQAIALDIPILSPDAQLERLGTRRIW
jgi:PIN domain nuclease of toxin-antitoxin system